MKFSKQTKDWNCGPTACAYYFARFQGIQENYDQRIDLFEKIGNCTKDKGTSHEGMVKIIHEMGFNSIWNYADGIEELIPALMPCIVNYQYDGDGHYGVIEGFQNNDLLIWNPATGKRDKINKYDFEKIWYSKRYGSKWFLHPVKI